MLTTLCRHLDVHTHMHIDRLNFLLVSERTGIMICRYQKLCKIIQLPKGGGKKGIETMKPSAISPPAL